jgi:hypothetical protein
MSDCPEAASTAAGSPSTEARAARLAKFAREQLIVDCLNRGVSVAEIAARVGVGEKRMRVIIPEILARRQPHPPEEFVAIQISRLNEALLVAFSAMSGMNLKAVDRVVKIVRELDRYHGFVAAERRLPEPKEFEPPAEAIATFGAALTCCARLSSEDLEEIDFMPEIAKVLEAANPVEAPREEDSAFAVLGRSAPMPSALDSHPELTSSAWRLPSKQPRPEEPAERATRGTFQIAGARPIDRPSTRVARGDAPQDEGAPASDPPPGRGDRPENLPQCFENIGFAPGISNAPKTADRAEAARAQDDASQRPGPGPDASAIIGPLDGRPGKSPQALENMESAPGSGWPTQSASGEAVSEASPIPPAARFRSVRMILNGVAAC